MLRTWKRVNGLVALGCMVLLPWGAVAQKPAQSITNGSYKVQVTKVEQTPTMHGGMLKPPHPDQVFVVVYFETDDPCLDPRQNAACGAPQETPLAKVAEACGTLQTAAGTTYPADGGGLLAGGLACSFIVAKPITGVTLRLTGYPELKLSTE